MLEQRYWEVVDGKLGVWKGVPEASPRRVLGFSFGCRVAFSFAGRLDRAGCADVRVVLMDGRVSNMAFWMPQVNLEVAMGAMGDAVRVIHGDVFAANLRHLHQLPLESCGYAWQHGQMSGCVRVLFVESDECMGLQVVQHMAESVEVVRIEGWHLESLRRVMHGEEARTMAARFDAFFGLV